MSNFKKLNDNKPDEIMPGKIQSHDIITEDAELLKKGHMEKGDSQINGNDQKDITTHNNETPGTGKADRGEKEPTDGSITLSDLVFSF